MSLASSRGSLAGSVVLNFTLYQSYSAPVLTIIQMHSPEFIQFLNSKC